MDITSMLVRPSKTSPDFLETNATSHEWPFSAVAELIDNAYDPDVKAKQIHINYEEILGVQCLTFTDNGTGMEESQLYNMLSFGYSDKPEDGYKPIGRYGNGFKSGSMRLGRDALVFTRHAHTSSVGLLSRTYLKGIRADTVLVPILSIDTAKKQLINAGQAETTGNLAAILTWTMFKDVDALLQMILSFDRGTKILIYNLKRRTEHSNQLELDFDCENHDVLYVSTAASGEIPPEHRRSLRCYCSILYLRPRMKIYIMGEKVRQRMIACDLWKTSIQTYNPRWFSEPIKITFGFNPKRRKRINDRTGTSSLLQDSDYGAMLYNRNRLIRAYEKIGYQKQSNNLGVGVVAVLEVDALTPVHNKQSFALDSKYNALMSSLRQKLDNYIDGVKNLGAEPTVDSNDAASTPDFTWAMCDHCLKWRRLPVGLGSDDLPDVWHCKDNLDETHNTCDMPQESMEEGEWDVSANACPSWFPNRGSGNRRSTTCFGPRKKRRLQWSPKLDAHISRHSTPDHSWAKADLPSATRDETLRGQVPCDLNKGADHQKKLTIHKKSEQSGQEINASLLTGLEQNWARCQKCKNFRILEPGRVVDTGELWYCRMHPDSKFHELCEASVVPTGQIVKFEPSEPTVVDLTLESDEENQPVERNSSGISDQISGSMCGGGPENEALKLKTQIVQLTTELNLLRQYLSHLTVKSELRDSCTQTYDAAISTKNGASSAAPIDQSSIDNFVMSSESGASAAVPHRVKIDSEPEASASTANFHSDATRTHPWPAVGASTAAMITSDDGADQHTDVPRSEATSPIDGVVQEDGATVVVFDRSVNGNPTTNENDDDDVNSLRRCAVRLMEICGIENLDSRINVNSTSQVAAILYQIILHNKCSD